MVCENNIRVARPKDFPVILELYKKGLTELGEDFDAKFLEEKIKRVYHCAPCFLLETHDKIIGMAALHLGAHNLTGCLTLSDLLFYVEPEHRNLSRLSGLVEACKEFSKDHNIPLQLNFVTKTSLKNRERLLRMHGFQVNSIVGVYNG